MGQDGLVSVGPARLRRIRVASPRAVSFPGSERRFHRDPCEECSLVERGHFFAAAGDEQ